MASFDHRYKIVGWNNIFRTARSHDGRQLLIGVQLPELVAVVFDRDGALDSVSTYPLEARVREPDDDAVADSLDRAIRELGFIRSGIEVKEFFLPERWIGIKTLPEHYVEVLEHPDRFEESEREAFKDSIRRWTERGDFVLYWCEDYYLNRDGEVESS